MKTAVFRRKLLNGLGGPWPSPCELRPKRVGKPIRKKGYTISKWSYFVEPAERVSAFLLVPDGIDSKHPVPAITVWHQHNGEYHIGKSEPAGLTGNRMHHTGAALAREGYVVLCTDALCFEERQDPTGRLVGVDYERFEFLRYVVAGKSLAWKNIFDMKRAVDFLVSRPEVKKDQIGCYGHSMGATHTWLIGPWEKRIRCLVGNCCLPTYAGIHREHMLHCFPNFIPGLYQYGDTYDIAALIAPRPLLLNFGELDKGSPVDEVRKGIKVITSVYKTKHATGNFSFYVEKGAEHVLSQKMWRRTLDWFNRHLRY
ncbi:MAG: alpha/beta hydrolase family protein [Kiritimatiellae bacterium]|nr:alpha/beta hydrolase family protein [Kiritimatiellia bacterium]